MRRYLRNNGLTLVLVALFLLSYGGGQLLAGWKVCNEERREHGEPALGLKAYLRSAHFAEATMENWESEFLQMFVYVGITAFLFQKGSAESNDPDAPRAEDPARSRGKADAPWPVRRGGWWLRLYAHSLSLALAGLFLVSFAGHACSSARLASEERVRQGLPPVTVWRHLGEARFWFESFQNWQSEFLSIALMVVLTIHLREKNSPESKPVDAPHTQTG